MPTMTIDGRQIGDYCQPYIVAEMSCNHGGSLDVALKTIEQAKRAGANAVKLQTFTADTMTIDCAREEFQIRSGPWAGRSMYEIYSQASTPAEWHKDLFQSGRDVGITVFSTPFDEDAVDFLEDLNCPAYKISSYEITDLPLIGYAASTRKPLILSTGMARKEEIMDAVACARDNGCKELAVLHCISAYPTLSVDANLATMDDIAATFGAVTGLSDHSIGTAVALAAVARGAKIVEKHFGLLFDSLDADFSIGKEDFSILVNDSMVIYNAIGRVRYGVTMAESNNLRFRRSLYFVKDIKRGEVITSEHVRRIRPGYGISPKYHYKVIGKTAEIDVERGTPCRWEQFS